MEPTSRWSLRRIRRWFKSLFEQAGENEERKAELAATMHGLEAAATEVREIREVKRTMRTTFAAGTPKHKRYSRYFKRLVRLMQKYRNGKKSKPGKVHFCKSEIERVAELIGISAAV